MRRAESLRRTGNTVVCTIHHTHHTWSSLVDTPHFTRHALLDFTPYHSCTQLFTFFDGRAEFDTAPQRLAICAGQECNELYTARDEEYL